jgi:hypothetical protein
VALIDLRVLLQIGPQLFGIVNAVVLAFLKRTVTAMPPAPVGCTGMSLNLLGRVETLAPPVEEQCRTGGRAEIQNEARWLSLKRLRRL